MNTAEPRRTATDERVDVVQTGCAVEAGPGGTLVDVLLTVATTEPGRALTLVLSQQVDTLAAVLTGLCRNKHLRPFAV